MPTVWHTKYTRSFNMRDKIEDAVVGGVKESISNVTGAFKAVKFFIYTVATILILGTCGAVIYGAYSLTN